MGLSPEVPEDMSGVNNIPWIKLAAFIGNEPFVSGLNDTHAEKVYPEVFTVPPLPGQIGTVIDAPAASLFDQAPTANVMASECVPLCACDELTVMLVMALTVTLEPLVSAFQPSVPLSSKPQFMQAPPVVQLTVATLL